MKPSLIRSRNLPLMLVLLSGCLNSVSTPSFLPDVPGSLGRMADILSPNCRNILNTAEHLAVKNNSPFVGTEHVLASLLASESRILPWLVGNPVGLDRDMAERQAGQMINLTRYSGSPSFYSPSLERLLAIGGALWSDNQLPTEGLVIGALLAHKEVKNGMGSIIYEAAGGRDVLEMLLDTLPFAKNRPEKIPPNNSVKFGFTWSDTVVPKSIHGKGKATHDKITIGGEVPGTEDLPEPPVRGTHWVIPGRLLCGRSPGDMSAKDIMEIVKAGVDTFVNLQESYQEYGCTDYRQVLQSSASQSFPPHDVTFLHCPIPDFGVLTDKDFIAFISELKRALENERTLYIHCFGGHGRTGTVVLNLLEVVYGVDRKKAMDKLRGYHRMRGCGYCALNQGELEGRTQTLQAKRMEVVMHKRSKMINK